VPTQLQLNDDDDDDNYNNNNKNNVPSCVYPEYQVPPSSFQVLFNMWCIQSILQCHQHTTHQITSLGNSNFDEMQKEAGMAYLHILCIPAAL
jgi:hypothetical protein